MAPAAAERLQPTRCKASSASLRMSGAASPISARSTSPATNNSAHASGGEKAQLVRVLRTQLVRAAQGTVCFPTAYSARSLPASSHGRRLAEAFTEGRCALAGIKQSLRCVRKPCGGVAKAVFEGTCFDNLRANPGAEAQLYNRVKQCGHCRKVCAYTLATCAPAAPTFLRRSTHRGRRTSSWASRTASRGRASSPPGLDAPRRPARGRGLPVFDACADLCGNPASAESSRTVSSTASATPARATTPDGRASPRSGSG